MPCLALRKRKDFRHCCSRLVTGDSTCRSLNGDRTPPYQGKQKPPKIYLRDSGLLYVLLDIEKSQNIAPQADTPTE